MRGTGPSSAGDAINVQRASEATRRIRLTQCVRRQATGFYDQRRFDDEIFAPLAFEWTHLHVGDYRKRHSLTCPALAADGNLVQPIGDNADGTVSDFLSRIE